MARRQISVKCWLSILGVVSAVGLVPGGEPSAASLPVPSSLFSPLISPAASALVLAGAVQVVPTVAPIPAATAPAAAATPGGAFPSGVCGEGLGPGNSVPAAPLLPPVVPIPKLLPKGFGYAEQSVNAFYAPSANTQAIAFGSRDLKRFVLVTLESRCPETSTFVGQKLVPDLPPIVVGGMTVRNRKALSVSFPRQRGAGVELVTVWQIGDTATTALGIELARAVPQSGLLGTMKNPAGMVRRFFIDQPGGWLISQAFSFRPKGLPDPFGPRVVVSLDDNPSFATSVGVLMGAKEVKLGNGSYAFVTSAASVQNGTKRVDEWVVSVVGSRVLLVRASGLPSGTAARVTSTMTLGDAVAFQKTFGVAVTVSSSPNMQTGVGPSANPTGPPTTFVPATPVGPVPVTTAEPRASGGIPSVPVTTSPANGYDILGPVAINGSSNGTAWEVRVRSVGEVPDDRDRQLICAVVIETGSRAVATGNGPNCSIVPGYPTRRPPVGFDNVSANVGALTYLVVFVPPGVSHVLAMHDDASTTRHEVYLGKDLKSNASRLAVIVVGRTITELRSVDAKGNLLGSLRGSVAPGLPGGWSLV